MTRIIGLLCLLLALPGPAAAVVVAVFNGAGTCRGCGETVGALFAARGDRVVYLDQHTLSARALARVRIYVQPGGSDDIDDTLDALSARQVRAIRDFVRGGGSYLGICAGAYLAARYSSFADKTPAYGLVPLPELQPEAPDPKPSLLRVRWGNRIRMLYNQSGAQFGSRAGPGVQVLARYIGSGHIAALRTTFGKGRVLLIGPHPEASRDWYAADRLSLRYGLNLDLLRDAMKRL